MVRKRKAGRTEGKQDDKLWSKGGAEEKAVLTPLHGSIHLSLTFNMFTLEGMDLARQLFGEEFIEKAIIASRGNWAEFNFRKGD